MENNRDSQKPARLRHVLPYAALALTFCLPSVSKAQVYDSLEIGNNDSNAVQVPPPDTPRLKINAAQLAAGSTQKVSITTYHNDNRRDGWNSAESILTPANVGSSQFNLLHAVPLDDQVDAQPLLLTNQLVGKTTQDVVYVATEGNTIYAIDANSGGVLLSRNFGSPVPKKSLPAYCGNNGPNVGINSTPVIDPVTRIMYAMVYTLESGGPVYRLHALDPGTLSDVATPRVVSASQTLSDGTIVAFQAYAARQRSALLVTNGSVYAAFASFCDADNNVARGWILGWQTNSLNPLSHNHLDDRLAKSKDNYFLTSVWMSGYGMAAEGGGNLLFVTGNSDPSGDSYSPTLNLSESVVKLSTDLSTVKSYFTPSNVGNLEIHDTDLGSGGVMALPTQPGSTPALLVAAGKDGRMFLMNRWSLGGYSPGTKDNVVGTYPIGNCWCGPSYFVGADGVARVVSSGGDRLILWKLQTSPSTALVAEKNLPAAQPFAPSVQDGGSFTTVSSNGTQSGTAVVWTVRRPTNNTTKEVTLYAFDASAGTTLASAPAGTWPSLGGNANIVPTVANGKVYVASYQQLSIFGIGASGAVIARPTVQGITASVARPSVQGVTASLTTPGNRVSGTVASIGDGSFTLTTISGRPVVVLTAEAVQLHQSVPPTVGENLEARGTLDASGVLHASSILHAKQSGAWLPDQ